MRADYPLEVLCETLQVSKSGYHAWRSRKPSARQQRDQALSQRIEEVHAQSRRTYGSPRVHQELRRAGERASRKRIARLMRQKQIQGRSRRRRRPRTTDSRHAGPIAPHLLKGRAPASRLDEVWLTDITYLPTRQGWVYLAAVLDAYSRRIIGWAFSDCLDTTLCLRALRMALLQRRPKPGCIHHSDRGVQYASKEYIAAISAAGLVRSMSRRGNCYDNAAMESVWSTLKFECASSVFASKAAAPLAIFDYIETFYNRVRLHSSLGYRSPLEFEQCSPRTNHQPIIRRRKKRLRKQVSPSTTN